MATVRWTPQASAVAQESRATPANVEIGDVFTLKIGGVTIATFTAAAATVANVTAGLAAAWATSTHPWATAITASDQTTYLKLLANQAGIPFTVTSTTTDGGGANTQTLSITTPTAASGPNDWSTASNWSGGSVPVNSDTVIIENSNVPILWGLDQSAVTLAELRVMQSYTGYIGLPEEKFATTVDPDTWLVTSTSVKPEYRDCYLKIGATLLNIGQNNGVNNPGGSSRLKINLGSAQYTGRVYNSGTASFDNKQPILLLGTHASNALYVYGGIVGVANSLGSEVSTIATLNQSGGDVTFGKGVTWTDVYKANGKLQVNSPSSSGNIYNSNGDTTVWATSSKIANIFNYAGSTSINGSLTVDAANVYGGTIYYNTTGTLTAAKIDSGGELNCLSAGGTQTISLITIYGGGSFAHNPTLTTVSDMDYALANIRSTYTTAV